MTDLDPKLTFDTFVVGPANRLASAAARRAADSPGTSYNPLFVYAGSGLGKTHILHAVAHHVHKGGRGTRVEYMALEGYLEELEAALESGRRDAFKDRYGDLEILLLDDVQFLAGQNEAQEMLLRAGSQIMLASDRAPAEIDGLDARLLSRFSGGLIVDIGAPEYETRVAIVRRKAGLSGQRLATGVAEALGRYPFKNVRELGGALNRVLAAQDLEGRQISAEEVKDLIGGGASPSTGGRDDFGTFLEDLAGAVALTVEAKEQPWRKALRESIEAAEREGFSAQRLKMLQGGHDLPGWEEIVRRYRTDLQRLRDIDYELDQLSNPWPDAAGAILKDPDRLDEAEALLASVRERQRPFPRLTPGPDLDELGNFPRIALKAVQQLIGSGRPEYNPLYLWSERAERGRVLLGAAGRTFQALSPESRMAVTSVREFASDFIRALGAGVAGAWRERWWTADLLLVHGVEALSETERAQDEFFHLFEALKRRGARVLLVADRPPSAIDEVDERLRSRFEGGLVLEVESGQGDDPLELAAVPVTVRRRPDWNGQTEVGATAGGAAEAAGEPSPKRKGGSWFPSRENVVLRWPKLEDFLEEDLD